MCRTCVAASDAHRGFIELPTEHSAALDRVVRLGRYFAAGAATPLAESLLRFKYHGDRADGHALRTLFGTAAADLGDASLVIPVPLHPARLKHRGYNQSAWLARTAARMMRREIDATALRRIEDTPPQASADGRRRREMRGVFSGCRDRVSGRSVLLVDDVYTTGATVADAARALRAAGARHVSVAVLLAAGRD